MIKENKIHTIYCDFDGTITKNDAVNSFFDIYADKKWLDFESMWVDGKISSKENAIQQVALLPEVSANELNKFINSIEIDEYFIEFLKFLKTKNIKFVILSDGFDLFINKTLERFGISDIEVFANHIIYKDNKFKIEFPYNNPNCDIDAGMCKCNRVKEKEFCYIGDGTSDLCVAKKAKILFAKKNLKQYCEKYSIGYYSYDSFKDIINIINIICS